MTAVPAAADGSTQASSRRTTGNRSSTTTTVNPTLTQHSGVAALVASGRAPSSGYASTAEKPRPARSPQTDAINVAAWPASRATAVVAMHVITAGNGESGNRG